MSCSAAARIQRLTQLLPKHLIWRCLTPVARCAITASERGRIFPLSVIFFCAANAPRAKHLFHCVIPPLSLPLDCYQWLLFICWGSTMQDYPGCYSPGV